MLEWIDKNEVKKELKRIKDHENLKKLEEKLSHMESLKEELKLQREVVEFAKEYIVEAYRRIKYLPAISDVFYIDSYVCEDRGNFMLGVVKDTYFISYPKDGTWAELVLFKKDSTHISDSCVVRSFKVATVELGIFSNPVKKTVKSYDIPAIVVGEDGPINNEQYCQLLNKTSQIDFRRNRYSSILLKK